MKPNWRSSKSVNILDSKRKMLLKGNSQSANGLESKLKPSKKSASERVVTK